MTNLESNEYQNLQKEATLKWASLEKDDDLRYQLYLENQKDENSALQREKSVLKVQKLTNRLRRFVETEKAVIISELHKLDISMHLSEICSSICDGPMRLKDINALIEICSLLYRQYSVEFSNAFIECLMKSFSESASNIESFANATKRKSLPRLLIELMLVGSITQDSVALRKIVEVLCDVSRINSQESLVFNNVAVLEMICRKFEGALLGGPPGKKQKQYDEVLGKSFQRKCGLNPKLQEAIRAAVTSFFTLHAGFLCQHAQSLVEQQAMSNQQKRIIKGQVDADSESKYKNALLLQERLKAQCETLADLLGENMPILEPEKGETGELVTRMYPSNAAASSEKLGEPQKTLIPQQQSLWDDEAEADFYENILNLIEAVPGSLLGTSNVKDTNAGVTTTNLSSIEEDSSLTTKTVGISENETQSFASSTNIETNKKNVFGSETADRKVLLLDKFFEKLCQTNQASEINTLAISFFYDQLNVGKLNRRRLVKLMLTTHRNDVYLLPTLTRFLVTIQPFCRDTVNSVVEGALHDYKALSSINDPMRLESKIKAVRFVGEMCKFQLIPTGTTLEFMQELLEDFNHVNLQVACHLIQCCGRYLLHYQGLGERFKNSIMSKLTRMKTMRTLPVYLEMMIEDTYYQIFPNEMTQTVTKEKPIVQKYIWHVVRVILHQKNVNVIDIVRSIRRLPWDSTENFSVHYWLKKEIGNMLRSSTVAYHNLSNIAAFLCGLAPSRPAFVVDCIDELMEMIQLGLEQNDYRESPYRVRCVKLVGELFNSRLINTTGILDLLYHLIGFGGPTSYRCSSPSTFRTLAVLTNNTHLLVSTPSTESLDFAETTPSPLIHPSSPEDSTNNCFRIRLICIILQTTGQYFLRGSAKEKMDRFIIFFQRYIMFKPAAAASVSINFLILDTLTTMRPKLKMLTTLDDIDAAIINIVHNDDIEDKEEVQELEGEEVIEDDEQSNSETATAFEDVEDELCEDDESEFSQSFQTATEQEDILSEKDEEEKAHIVSELAMFDAELSNIVVDSIHEAKSNIALLRNKPSPVENVRFLNVNKQLDDKHTNDTEVPSDSLRVRLLTRKGKDKVQIKPLTVPKDSRLFQALHFRDTEDAEEHAQIKQFVLDSVIRSRKQEMIERENQIRHQLFLPSGRNDRTSTRQSYGTYVKQKRKHLWP